MLKVAFATSDRVTVDQHFGASAGFAIHAVDAERARLVEVAEFPEESMDGGGNEISAEANADMGRSHNKLADKVSALTGCAAVYCLAVGGSAVRQLLAAGVQPIRLEEKTGIDVLLSDVRRAVREGGVAWIDRAFCRAGDLSRFDRMAEEGWQE